MRKYRIAQHMPSSRVRLWKMHAPFVRPALSGWGLYAFSHHYPGIPLDVNTVRSHRLQSAARNLAVYVAVVVSRIERRLEDCDTSHA